ncbi:Ribosomal protein S6--L-glutamate ligase [termite gut metagenome]|uniref:Ribosomal protein S6--L-glutamate ligase n=1 Tax=termite gut metagenome TaxID=433724 RepID=A0A5J4SPS6_9ZZZZ
MKIAIHINKGFAECWIAYCKDKNISYKIVNCYDNNIIEQLSDCDALMWAHHQADYKDCLFAKQLLYSLEISGKKVFPNFNTCWHFDDKVGQKYLLESIGAPLVPSYVFYSKKEALDWVNKTTFPKVFKLRGGAGSANVKLAKTKKQATSLINKAFGRGFSQFDKLGNLKERIRKFKEGKGSFWGLFKGIARLFITTEFAKMHANEKGYVYFQDFIPDNKFDIRIVVVGDKACGIKRLVRKNDFRASGSGNSTQKKSEINDKCVRIAFELNHKLKTQSIAIDFVFKNNQPLIVETSYGFVTKVYEGYWDSNMVWYEGNCSPLDWVIDNLIGKITK